MLSCLYETFGPWECVVRTSHDKRGSTFLLGSKRENGLKPSQLHVQKTVFPKIHKRFPAKAIALCEHVDMSMI